jgi:hypothetical protein
MPESGGLRMIEKLELRSAGPTFRTGNKTRSFGFFLAGHSFVGVPRLRSVD